MQQQQQQVKNCVFIFRFVRQGNVLVLDLNALVRLEKNKLVLFIRKLTK